MRGDVYRLPSPRGVVGHEQHGARYAVALQSDDLPLSTLIVAPTSASAAPARFRPEITVRGATTRVLVEQLTAVDPQRLGARVGTLSGEELADVAGAVRRVLSLDLPW